MYGRDFKKKRLKSKRKVSRQKKEALDSIGLYSVGFKSTTELLKQQYGDKTITENNL